MTLKCSSCRYEKLEPGVGPCADCVGFTEWRPKKEEKVLAL